MPLVRALTVHIERSISIDDAVNASIRVSDRLLNCLKSVGLEVWTIRLVLPPFPRLELGDCRRIVEELSSALSDKFFLHPLSFDGVHPCVSKIVELVDVHERVYASILCKSVECLSRVLTMLWSVEVDPLVYTRLAIVVGDWVETPYFPATTSLARNSMVTAALRYVDAAMKALSGDRSSVVGFVRSIEDKIKQLADCTLVGYGGLDLSLSPWMDESVAGLAERVLGTELEGANGIYAAYALKQFIDGVASEAGVKTIGFNEPMFAVAEDNLLDQRVREKRVRLRDLVAYSTACVAGVDMVAVPLKEVNPVKLAQGLWGVYMVKGKPFGVRVIPVDKEPGTVIKLGRFGSTTVIFP